jgi:hypothetical protein
MRRVRKANATTEYGHGISLSVRVSPAMAHAISVLVSSDRWDYQNTSGFILAALSREMEWCEETEPGIGEWHHVELIEELIRVKDEQLRFKDIIHGLRDQLNEMADAGEWDDLQRHVENIMASIHKQSDGSRKETYLKYMKEFELRLSGLGLNGNEGSKGMTLPAPRAALQEAPDE